MKNNLTMEPIQDNQKKIDSVSQLNKPNKLRLKMLSENNYKYHQIKLHNLYNDVPERYHISEMHIRNRDFLF